MSTTADSRDRTPTVLPSQYDPAAVEEPLYERWVARGYFTADPASGRPTYCIVIPPPNVTGSLHIGHALDHSVQDALIRWRRMQGYEALWLPGMDHAGIATQNVVERELAAEGVTRFDLGREAFVERVWCWKQEYGGRILGQMRRLGDSVDWTRERFTMDPGLSRAVRTIFKRLYDDGLIYRAERIINWCPRCHTALSDIEVEHHEDEGELVSLRYGEGDASVVVATTRVETMLGDTGIAVHPDDARYRHLVGTEIELPLTGRRIPVVADDHVDPEFGTGAVKVTPAHDPNDFEIAQRHGLPALQVMDERARIVNTGLAFDGMDRLEARAAVKEALRAQGRVVAERSPYLHAVGHCSRCDTVVEPRLSLQWFVRVATLAQAAGDAVRDGRVAFHPPEMARRYFDWVDHMHDWCISRQLWWGHRIPVWYGPGGEMRCPGPDEPDPGEGWTQDADVLDTWFSSALWPFSTLGWPEPTDDLAAFYPTDVLVTGPDIIFFWVARMMMFGLYAMDGVPPFHTVALHGLVRDEHGKKMSKSRGNTIDPMLLLDSYGADALRFTLLRGANPGTDLALSEDWVQGSRNFCNKLWNATRFALLNGAETTNPVPGAAELTVADRWILSRLHGLLGDVDTLLGDFQLAKTVEALYHFVWDEFCDWYVEIAKTQLDEDGAGFERAATTRAVLGHVLDALLRALHPVAPFVTETLWTALTGAETVVRAAWPVADPTRLDAAAETELADLQAVVTEVRRFRAEQGLRPGQRVPARITAAGSKLAAHEPVVRALARLQPSGDGFQATATLPVAGVEIALDLSGAIDVAAERARLGKDLQAARQEIQAAEAKLGNPDFVAKAPAAVVDKVRGRLDAARGDAERIERQLTALPAS